MIGLRAALSISIALILCAALAVVGWSAQRAVSDTIAPAIAAKGDAVARGSASLIQRALQAGIPFAELKGVDASFAALRSANPEVSAIELVDAAGVSRVRVGEAASEGAPAREALREPVRAPILLDGAAVGAVMLWVDPGVVSQRVRSMLLDMAFLGVVALLIALELLALAVGSRSALSLGALEDRLKRLAHGKLAPANSTPQDSAVRALTAPIDAHLQAMWARHHQLIDAAQAKGDTAALAELRTLGDRHGIDAPVTNESRAAAVVRPALFLFMLSDELTRPFLPGFVRSIAPDGWGIGLDVLVSLPMAAFMLTMALCQLPFASLSERIGRREGFLAGAVLAALGYAVAALTTHYGVFAAARIVTAIGYTLVFVSAQGHIIDGSTAADRSRSLAVFVGAILVAALCGPPIGGVIADRLGASAAFVASAVLALLACAAAWRMLPKRTPRTGAVAAGFALQDVSVAVRTPRLLGLLFGCAFPAKFILAAICFYLVPVELDKQGYGSAEIGRLQMIYPLIMVVCVPLFAALADRLRQRTAFVVMGGVLAGAGALLAGIGASPAVIASILLLLGLGQAMSITSQSALVADSARQAPGASGAVLGVFRLVERGGNAAGQAAAGILLGAIGFSAATLSIGALVVAGALGFAWSVRPGSRPTETSSRP